MLALLALLLAVPVRAACEAAAPLVDAEIAALAEGRTETMPDLSGRVEASLGCSPADPSLLARHFSGLGAWMVIEQSPEDAGLAFATAERLDPDGWPEALGDELREARDAILAEQAAGAVAGELRLDGEAPGYRPAVDGAERELPAPISAGLHLVQLLAPDDAVVFGRIVAVPPTAPVAVEVPPLPPVAVAVAAPPRRHHATWLAISGGSALLAGGSALGALAQDGRMRQATDLDEVDAAFRTQQVLAASTWAFAGLAAGGLVLQFAL